jgi:hypothetical protein
MPGEPFFFVFFALMFLAVVAALALTWTGVYIYGRRCFPWWTLPPAVVGPIVAWVIHLLMLRGHIPETPAWIAIWSVLGGALAVALALGLIRGPTGPRPIEPSRLAWPR